MRGIVPAVSRGRFLSSNDKRVETLAENCGAPRRRDKPLLPLLVIPFDLMSSGNNTTSKKLDNRLSLAWRYGGENYKLSR